MVMKCITPLSSFYRVLSSSLNVQMFERKGTNEINFSEMDGNKDSNWSIFAFIYLFSPWVVVVSGGLSTMTARLLLSRDFAN